MKPPFFKITLGLAVLQLALLLALTAPAASFTVTPNTVSNTYNGLITLQITGLTNGETVVVQKYLDATGDGAVTPGEAIVQQFTLTDGQASLFHDGATVVTNFNVPGDTDALTNQITAQLNFASRDFSQNIVANYLYVISSPTTNWTPVANSFTVTSFPFPQTLNGSVTNSSGLPVPYAVVILFGPPRAGHHDGPGTTVAAAIANVAGAYSLKLPVGSYVPLPSQKNFVADFSASPVVTLASNATVTANLGLISTTRTISGRYVDAATNSIGLPGVFVPVNTDAGLIGVAFTDPNGGFSAGVTPGTWDFGGDGSGLIVHGYVASQNGTNVDTTSGSVSNIIVAFPRGTALFYGKVQDATGNPLPGIDILSQDSNNLFEQDAIADANGNYAAVALDAATDGPWQLQASSGSDNPANEIFSDGAYAQGTNLNVGQAVHQSFTGVVATNLITGTVKDSGNNPISGVGMFATANIGGKSFSNGNANTDDNGNYSLTVAAGIWTVSVDCNGGNNTLSGLGYSDCPDSQMVNTTISNGVANFTVQTTTTTLSGRVIHANGQPVTFMNVFASPNGGGSSFEATTDSNGDFTMGISGGSYTAAMNTDAATGAASLGLVSPFLPLTITDGVNVSNFVLVAQPATGIIAVSVKNSANNAPIEGVNAVANLTLNGTNYSSGTQTTDSSGKVTLVVFNGTWAVSLANAAAPLQHVLIMNNTNSAPFFITFTGASPPTLSSPVRLSPTQVQLTINGVAGKTYTLQACNTLPNWSTLFLTNAPANSFPVIDPAATNKTRFYRVQTAP